MLSQSRFEENNYIAAYAARKRSFQLHDGRELEWSLYPTFFFGQRITHVRYCAHMQRIVTMSTALLSASSRSVRVSE